MNEDLQNQIKKLRNLVQCRNKTDEELIDIIEKKSETKKKIEEKVPVEKVDDLNIDNLFNDKDEKKYGRELLSKYLDDFKLETISDINLLKQLIYLEVFQRLRLQKTAEQFQKENNAVPLQILDSIHRNLDKIIELKNSLRLTKDTTEQTEGYKAFELLLKKGALWRKENQASRECSCPHCGKMILWIMRPEVWEVYKHPFFKDKILGNPHIVNLYAQGRLTKEDITKIFNVATDYIDWLCDKWGVKIEQVPPKE